MERTKTVSAIEKLFTKKGEITSVRSWDGGGLHELDIFLPHVNFDKWETAQKVKCRISPFHYTDYTPAMWNAAEETCTLYIDTSHSGQGSQWARGQKAGNPFYYLHIESAKHYPVAGKHLVFLGDGTAVGHFCALQQLASDGARINGWISLKNQQMATSFANHCPQLPLQAVQNNNAVYDQTEEWIIGQADKEQFLFYIVGNAHLVVRIRKMLKQQGISGIQIKSEGFWQ